MTEHDQSAPSRKHIQELLEAAAQVVSEYGKVVQATSDIVYGVPESRLPYPKDGIKKAIRFYLMCVIGTDKEDHALVEGLKLSYMRLAAFVPDAVAHSTRAEDTAISGAGREEVLEAAHKVTDAMAEMAKEFDDYVADVRRQREAQ
ncbi:MAG: hypothetical protein AMJ69_02155 [Gammaproteobacteria bacterium SG8_47]|nr:MAG: hypothetical protein AMJ69_02155 [Gammaproteobacteria bacterium SG8_47]